MCYAHKSHATQQRLGSLFIDKHVSCRAHPWSPIFQDIVGHFLLHDLHDLSGLFSSKWWGMIPRSQQLGEPPVMLPRFAPMMLPLHPRSAPMRLPLHPRSVCPQGSPSYLSCCVSCWLRRSIIQAPTSMPSRKLKDSHIPLHAACRIRFCLRKAAAVHRCRILGSVLSLARPRA